MPTRKKILAISGSTRKVSSNLDLINEIVGLTRETNDITIFRQIDDLPHFNPDLDIEPAPETVTNFRNQLRSVDGVLICTPEYAMGVPGTLKNAIDWLVSSCELSHKPLALITAGSMGQKGHASLLDTLHIIEANVTDDTQLIISFVRTKIKGGKITDEKTLAEVTNVMAALNELMSKQST